MTLGYYAMCSKVDHHFGRLMAKLKERGVDDNTLAEGAKERRRTGARIDRGSRLPASCFLH